MTGVATLEPLASRHRSPLEALLRAADVFRPDEIGVALELFDAYLARPGCDYDMIGAFADDVLLGYACFGPTPCTQGTWDLYWIAVAPGRQRAGTGALLLGEVEAVVRARGARLLLIETSARSEYAPARGLYERCGFRVVARVPDFYAPGDDRLIYSKRFPNGPPTGEA